MENGNSTPMYMPVAPAYGYGNNGGLFGGDMGGGWWFILLVLLMGGGLWGGFGGMGGYGGFMNAGLDYMYPWLNNSQHISDGFRDQQLNTQIGDLRSDVNRGFGDVQLGLAGIGRQICETGNGITGAINNGFYSAEIAANGRQMANLQGFNAIGTGIADLKYTVATENCADRTALNEVIRDIIAAQTAGFQSIKDQLYSDKMDAKNDEIAQLRQEILFARGQASQIAQDSRIIDGVYNRLDQCPVSTTPVFGRTPIFSCNNNGGCGCGCGGNTFMN